MRLQDVGSRRMMVLPAIHEALLSIGTYLFPSLEEEIDKRYPQELEPERERQSK